jgi:hypothetical protein
MDAYRPTREPKRRTILLPNRREGEKGTPSVMAGGAQVGKGVAGTVGNAVAILEGVLRDAPTKGAKSAA